jgi:hypothetical protein
MPDALQILLPVVGSSRGGGTRRRPSPPRSQTQTSTLAEQTRKYELDYGRKFLKKYLAKKFGPELTYDESFPEAGTRREIAVEDRSDSTPQADDIVLDDRAPYPPVDEYTSISRQPLDVGHVEALASQVETQSIDGIPAGLDDVDESGDVPMPEVDAREDDDTTQRPIDAATSILRPDPTRGVSPLEDFRLELRSQRLTSVFNPAKPYFIPAVRLWNLLTVKVVYQLLREIYPGDSETSLGSLAEDICTQPESNSDSKFRSYRAIFALLISISKQDRIRDFVELFPELDDYSLPLTNLSADPKTSVQLALRSEDAQPHLFFADPMKWGSNDLEFFYERQWEFCAPFFRGHTNEPVLHYKLGEKTVLPFTAVEQRSRRVSRGGSSRVVKYFIDNDQHQLPKLSVCLDRSFPFLLRNSLLCPAANMSRFCQMRDGKAIFAVKRLKWWKEFNEEDYISRRMRYPRCENLAKLLATFEVATEDGVKSCFIFPCADMNLEEFWNEQVRNPQDVGRMAEWMASQCQGLADALAHIHNYERAVADQDPRIHGIHGDIKPENILVFKQWRGKDAGYGLLQLADFGVSSYHDVDSIHNVSPRVGTHRYMAPEGELSLKANQSWDVWSLGCLFLDFVVWFVRGRREQKRFATDLISPMTSSRNEMAFYDLAETDEPGYERTTVFVSDAVVTVC